MADVFAALANPTRRDILSLLAHGELPAGAIARRLALSAPAASNHLRILREAGLVRGRRHGQQRLFVIDPEGIRDCRDFLDRLAAGAPP